MTPPRLYARELMDIPEVRHFLKRLAAQWPDWGFFLNQAFACMKAPFDQHGFPEPELVAMSMGLVDLIAPPEKNRRFVSRPIPARGGLAVA